METVVCPNCETEIPISERMPSKVKCPGCGMEYGIEYEPDNPTFKEKVQKFCCTHEKQILGAAIAVGLALKAYLTYQSSVESSRTEEVSLPDASCDSIPSEADTESISEKPESTMNLDNYDTKIVDHPVSIRNLSESRFPSLEKQKQARDLGIELGLHQTIVDAYPQRHYTKKSE